MNETSITLTIGGSTITAALRNNPAARDLADQLPLTMDFSDYGGQEVLATLPRPLTLDNVPTGESAPSGTIGYYAPTEALVLYYSDVGRFNGIVRIGEMDGNVSLLEGWNETQPITIEISE